MTVLCNLTACAISIENFRNSNLSIIYKFLDAKKSSFTQINLYWFLFQGRHICNWNQWLWFTTNSVLAIQCCGNVSKSSGMVSMLASLVRSCVTVDLYVKIQRLGWSARLVNYARMRAWCVWSWETDRPPRSG